MPYNTRRKSLSLPSLGIHIPVTHAARAAASRAAASSASASPTTSSKSTPSSAKSMAPPSREDHHVSKRLKRAHSESEESDHELASAPLAKKRTSASKFDHTPPPSPSPTDQGSVDMIDADDAADDVLTSIKKVDLEGINDEIVEAVIVQLQDTGNRPHLVKELAAVLMQNLKIVQQSANPAAIISSRLSSYLKRPCWSALAPCPLAKELETVHPRRTYFYLSTCPHQPLPDPAQATALSQLANVRAAARAIISPALSSAPSASAPSEDADADSRRRELSPSPEVDLSSPEFDDVDDDIAMPSTPIGSLSLRGGFYFSAGAVGGKPAGPAHGSARHHHNRATSPPLEKDEKEFTQTADGLQKRNLRSELLSGSGAAGEKTAASAEADFGSRDDSGLFGGIRSPFLASANANAGSAGPTMAPASFFVTSPAMRPSLLPLHNLGKKDAEADGWSRLDVLEWDRSPENIELDELDCLLSGY